MSENIVISLNEKQRDIIVEHCFPGMYLDFNLEDIPAVNGTVEVEFNKSELEGLLGSISGEANHAKVRKLALELDDIATMFECCLHPSCFITTFGSI